MKDKNPYLAQEAVMTPNDICDFKRKWLMASYYQVFIHTDMRNRTKDWLKQIEQVNNLLQNPVI